MSGKLCRPWSGAAFCGIWCGSAQYDQACQSEYKGKYGIFEPLNKTQSAKLFSFEVIAMYGKQIDSIR